MSEADVSTIERGLDAFNKGEIEEVAALLDPEVEMDPVWLQLSGERACGVEEVKSLTADMAAEWDDARIESSEIRDLGKRILVLGRFRARGRASGIAIDTPGAWVFEMRAGKVLRMRSYADQEAAIRDAEEQ